MKDKKDIISLIREDQWMMELLRLTSSLNLPDWWICAGFIRSKIWDTLHHFDDRTPLSDIDVIYFDPLNSTEMEEKIYEEKLRRLMPNIPWSVKNQARMHIHSKMPPYTSSVDAISKFPETATALGVKLDGNGNLVLTAPWDITDVVHLEVKPTPHFKNDKQRVKIYEERVMKKNWQVTWQKLKIYPAEGGKLNE
ncbi:nucleotidyltransferase family protein [Oceanobacillus indicireducens]|uniref:Nucleotidyltransferase family protein n=1 Tax=Oceanobacillus indicireducens TaxID=1004261 RepID=A0A917XUC0_9BACI|nr:nucleotidyltransferase family protein [Oceanobacillus indicireducens]GGN54260.1 hypothetical protein GCM10007971_11730 [Oceanobacillus indicireducens]